MLYFNLVQPTWGSKVRFEDPPKLYSQPDGDIPGLFVHLLVRIVLGQSKVPE